jgi:hypothetical protein
MHRKVCTVFSGRYWIPMDSYGFQGIPTDSYGVLWIPTDSYGFLWISIGINRFVYDFYWFIY